jgi:hypothetical protein
VTTWMGWRPEWANSWGEGHGDDPASTSSWRWIRANIRR